MIATPNIIDYILVIIPVAAGLFLGIRGLIPVMKGKFAIVCVAMFAAAIAVSMLLSFLSFALLSVMDDAVAAPVQPSSSSSTTSGGNDNIAVNLNTMIAQPVGKFLARSRFVRSVLVAFVQPTLLSVAGIASCLMLLYVRDGLVRVGGDITVLFEHFAVFSGK